MVNNIQQHDKQTRDQDGLTFYNFRDIANILEKFCATKFSQNKKKNAHKGHMVISYLWVEYFSQNLIS